MNRKGGVGKTSTAAGIGSMTALLGHNTLLVDFDPQANLSKRLVQDFNIENNELLNVLLDGKPVTPICTNYQNLDIVQSGRPLRQLARLLNPNVDAFNLLKPQLDSWCQHYSIIIVDGPPGEHVLQEAAIGAAPWIVAPTKMDDDSIEGLEDLAGLMLDQRKHHKPPYAELLGVVLFAPKKTATVQNRETETKIKEMMKAIGDEVIFESRIWEAATPAASMSSQGVLPSDIPPDWKGPHKAIADNYKALTNEILERHKKASTQ